MGEPEMCPSGDGVLATLTFNTIDVGIYTLNLYDVKLANKYLHQYPIPKYVFNDHVIGWEDDNYHIFTVSNSSVSPVRLYQLHCMLQFVASGSSGTTAFCNMTIPKALLSSPQGWLVIMDGMIYETFALTENDTYTVIGSKYKFESERVISIFGTEVIPEFPTPILLLPLLLLTVLMVIFVKLRKQRQITLRNP